MHLQLINQHAIRLHLNVDIKENQTLELENRFNFNVTYSDDNSKCKAVLNTEVRSRDNPDTLFITVEIEGLFTCENIDDEDAKKQAHVLAYTLLFPYAQYMVANLATSAGLPPIMIEMAKMDSKDIIIK